MNLIQRFDRAVLLEQSVCEDWESWFEPGYEESGLEEDWQEAGFAEDIFEEMLEAGIHYWSSLQWVNYILDTLGEWTNLIKVRLFAQELLRSVPPEFPHIQEFLNMLSQGDFCSALPGKASFYPNKSEYYLRSLQWDMVPYSLDSEADYRSSARAKVASKYIVVM